MNKKVKNECTESHIPKFPTTNEEYEICKNSLLNSAIVNIKKSNGHSSSDFEDLGNYLKEDIFLLKEQIENIDPDIILCGNTFEFLKMIFPDIQPCEEKIEFLYKY